MASNELFSCEEALGGLPARRASFLLFLIESRTTRMAAHSRQANERGDARQICRGNPLSGRPAALGHREPLCPRRSGGGGGLGPGGRGEAVGAQRLRLRAVECLW